MHQRSLRLGLLAGAALALISATRAADRRTATTPHAGWLPGLGEQGAGDGVNRTRRGQLRVQDGSRAPRRASEEALNRPTDPAHPPVVAPDHAPAATPDHAPAATPDHAPAATPDHAPAAAQAPGSGRKPGASGTGSGAWVLAEDGACPSGYEVKVKLSSGLYHLPGMLAYSRTQPDRCYASADAAEADGFTRARR
jgi:hypothetical protein